MARFALSMSLCSSLLLGMTAPLELSGPPRLYAGRSAARTVRGPGIAADALVRWRLVAYGAVIAEGWGRGPELTIDVPAAERRITAVLHVELPDRRAADFPVSIWPSRLDEIGRLLAARRPGVVGDDADLLALLERLYVPHVRLETPGAVRRYAGRLLLLAPGEADLATFAPAVLERVRDGLPVLSLGAASLVDAALADESVRRGLAVFPVLLELGLGEGWLVHAPIGPVARITDDPLAERLLLFLLGRLP